MAHVNRIILDRARSNVELIPELARHLIDSGGKRLRPMLTLAAAKLCSYDGDGHVRLAASVEFMHTATLLHDDVVDESNLRRGKTAARLVWGNEASVLVGDFLLGQAFKMMVDVGSLGALRILSDAAAVIAEGEVMQLITAKNTETTEDDYLAVIDAKTAALFAAAAEVGGGDRGPAEIGDRGVALLWPQSRPRLPARRRRARLFGRAVDARQERRRRFPRGQDHAPRGALLPPRQRRRARVLAAHAARGRDRRATISPRPWRLMKRHNALIDTMERARHYGAIARDALAIFADCEVKSALLEAIEFCVDRPF